MSQNYTHLRGKQLTSLAAHRSAITDGNRPVRSSLLFSFCLLSITLLIGALIYLSEQQSLNDKWIEQTQQSLAQSQNTEEVDQIIEQDQRSRVLNEKLALWLKNNQERWVNGGNPYGNETTALNVKSFGAPEYAGLPINLGIVEYADNLTNALKAADSIDGESASQLFERDLIAEASFALHTSEYPSLLIKQPNGDAYNTIGSYAFASFVGSLSDMRLCINQDTKCEVLTPQVLGIYGALINQLKEPFMAYHQSTGGEPTQQGNSIRLRNILSAHSGLPADSPLNVLRVFISDESGNRVVFPGRPQINSENYNAKKRHWWIVKRYGEISAPNDRSAVRVGESCMLTTPYADINPSEKLYVRSLSCTFGHRLNAGKDARFILVIDLYWDLAEAAINIAQNNQDVVDRLAKLATAQVPTAEPMPVMELSLIQVSAMSGLLGLLITLLVGTQSHRPFETIQAKLMTARTRLREQSDEFSMEQLGENDEQFNRQINAGHSKGLLQGVWSYQSKKRKGNKAVQRADTTLREDSLGTTRSEIWMVCITKYKVYSLFGFKFPAMGMVEYQRPWLVKHVSREALPAPRSHRFGDDFGWGSLEDPVKKSAVRQAMSLKNEDENLFVAADYIDTNSPLETNGFEFDSIRRAKKNFSRMYAGHFHFTDGLSIFRELNSDDFDSVSAVLSISLLQTILDELRPSGLLVGHMDISQLTSRRMDWTILGKDQNEIDQFRNDYSAELKLITKYSSLDLELVFATIPRSPRTPTNFIIVRGENNHHAVIVPSFIRLSRRKTVSMVVDEQDFSGDVRVHGILTSKPADEEFYQALYEDLRGHVYASEPDVDIVIGEREAV